MMTEQQQAGTRALSDMDVRMNGIKQRMTTLEDQLDARVASVSLMVPREYCFPVNHFHLTNFCLFWTGVTLYLYPE